MNILPINLNSPVVIPRRQTGFSLVEMLVALAIGLFLTIGVIQLFIGSKQSYRYHDALSRLQENGRFALNVMSQDIRMVGYRGCVSSNDMGSFRNTLASTAYPWNFNQPIQGFESTGEAAWSPALDASFESPWDGGNVDAITLRGADGLAGTPVLVHGSSTAALQIPVNHNFKACDIAIAASCSQSTVFQITTVSGGNLTHTTGSCSPGNSTDSLGDDFAKDGEVAPISTKNYYIRAGASGIPALWRRRNNETPQELVEGVERMEIRYGVCQGTPDKRQVNPPYVNANEVTQWIDVCSIRVDLLLVSLNDQLLTKATGETHSVIFPPDTGTVITFPATDRRIRQTFSTTVGIRNRLP